MEVDTNSLSDPEVNRAVADLKARQHAEDLKIAERIEAESEQTLAEARAFVNRFLASPQHSPYHWILLRWQNILNTQSPGEIINLFRQGDDATEELRASAPFCGEIFQAK
jgi:superfamily II RNA helicase